MKSCVKNVMAGHGGVYRLIVTGVGILKNYLKTIEYHVRIDPILK